MIEELGEKFTDIFKKNMPDAFVFALILTLVTGLGAWIWVGTSPLVVLESWYKGFWMLLEFGMQVVLLLITGYSIALSPLLSRGIDKGSRLIRTPKQVYLFVILIGTLLTLISWGWIVITAVIARELAKRVKGLNYLYLIACVYLSSGMWVSGLSSSIPLLLNTENNFMIRTEVLGDTIPITQTLGSTINYVLIILFIILIPVLMILLIPKNYKGKELNDLMGEEKDAQLETIEEEAQSLKLPYKAVSDNLNNSVILQYAIATMGLIYIVYHFISKGFDLNLNIMIFIFVILGLFLHKTPIRFGISMKRSSSNISGILFQYPFYAGIMGIMIYTGLGEKLAIWMASIATIETYPFFAFLTGGLVNFAIPSAGGEFAVIGPSVINAVKEIGVGLPEEQLTAMISRAVLSIAYGESLSNLLQPFYLLLILPVMGAGIKLQARDVMGYLVIPFLVLFVIESILVLWMPI
jgi:short-chain fatty acids transporter